MKKRVSISAALTRFVVAGLLTGLTGIIVSAQSAGEVDALLQKAIESKAVPAVGVAIVKDGKVVLTKGYGTADVDGGAAANENTGFQIASVTKQFTAVAVMMLVEEGKLSLSDPLVKYVPDVPSKWTGVTVRQLLNQVSGIPNYTAGGKLVQGKNYTHAEIIHRVHDAQPEFAPGARWQYSNTNYFLLGMIIEKVTGKPYASFMQERIFKPLGMTSTVINTSGLALKNAAIGHRLEAGVWKRQTPDDPSQPWAAGAIVSTPADMAKWAIAQGDTKLLRKASWDEIWALPKLTDGKTSGYGFGWGTGNVGETAYLSHGGGIAGFNSFIARFPNDNLTVFVVANANSRLIQPMAVDIAGLYLPKVGAVLTAQRAAKNAPPIADADPETTKFLKGAFEKMVTGEIAADMFDAAMQKALFPDRVKELKGPLGGQGAIKAFDLMKAENNAEGKVRVYRVTFESGLRVTATFALDPQGKIAGAGFRPEQ